jgi:hypothetical protein
MLLSNFEIFTGCLKEDLPNKTGQGEEKEEEAERGWTEDYSLH